LQAFGSAKKDALEAGEKQIEPENMVSLRVHFLVQIYSSIYLIA
jgi:hypothetical protein